MNAARRHRVLVVEDEFLVRIDLVDELEMAGFNVLEAGTAAEAVKILEGDREIAAVFTDINLPGTMDGIALAECVRKRWPPTVIVICSGNNLTDLRPIPPDIDFLPKPYEINTLDRVVKGAFAKLSDLA